MTQYDYVIIGAGFFGSVFAREMTEAGAKCLILEKRNHIGGNAYTKNEGGIHVHRYGAHIFHTNNKKIWDYTNRWTEFNHYTHRIKVCYDETMYSFPINMMTFHQLWGVKFPKEAIKAVESARVPIKNPSNLEEFVLSQVGEEVYEKFIYGYTKKQWGVEPNKLPMSIIKRIPLRFNYNDCYFADKYQGIPVNGYTEMFKNLLKDIPIEFEVDYLKDRDRIDSMGRKIVYTGALDEMFEYQLGELDWRSLSFEHETHDGDYQGSSVINYTSDKIPYTRILEHKFFDFKKQDFTIITKEYPRKWSRGKEKFYPINNEKNNKLQKEYENILDDRYIIGGRLAGYKYYDMHQVIGAALKKSEKEKL